VERGATLSGSSSLQRILVRGVNWLGDAVMSSPALLRLRAAHPAAHITLLSAQKLAELWQHHPAIDEVLPFHASEGPQTVAAKIRAGCFDLALIFPNSFRSALESWLARVPSRIGFGGSLRGWLLTQTVPPRPGSIRMRKRGPGEVRRLLTARPATQRETFPASAHHLHNYLWLVAHLGADPEPIAPSIAVTESEKAAFRAKFALPSASPGPLIGLNPGAEYGPAKRWPAKNFAETAALLDSSLQPRWLIFGGAADRASAEQIASILRARRPSAEIIETAGRTTLRELCAGLSHCAAVLTNDTGPMHLAAAVGARLVVPFGSTSPELTGPGLPGSSRHALLLGSAPCAPCFRRECPADLRCLGSITPELAAAALKKIISR